MMGVATYEGVYIAAQGVEQAGTLDKAKVRDAIAVMKMPQMVEAMVGGTISFSSDYRESKFELNWEQLRFNETLKEPRPRIVWPAGQSEASFVLPDWYEPGKA
jgi:hypothetical protein